MSIPLRYQSDDGWCVVELRARVRGTAVRADVATAVEVSDAVQRVIEECVVRASTGGSTRGFSGFFFLSFFSGFLLLLLLLSLGGEDFFGGTVSFPRGGYLLLMEGRR